MTTKTNKITKKQEKIISDGIQKMAFEQYKRGANHILDEFEKYFLLTLDEEYIAIRVSALIRTLTIMREELAEASGKNK